MAKYPISRARDLDLGSGHTAYRHASNSTYMANFIEIDETFCGRMDVRMDGRRHGWTFETGYIRSTPSKSRPKTTTTHNTNCESVNVRTSAAVSAATNSSVKASISEGFMPLSDGPCLDVSLRYRCHNGLSTPRFTLFTLSL